MKSKLSTSVLCALIGAALAIIMMIVLFSIQPLRPKKVHLCNDGWSYQTKDGKLYETYVEELDTCKEAKNEK